MMQIPGFLRPIFAVFPPETFWLLAGFFYTLLVAYLLLEVYYNARYWRIVLKRSRLRRIEATLWVLRLLLFLCATYLFGLVFAHPS